MANFLPFNSINNDRVYKAEDWAWYFSIFFKTGVFEGSLQVKEGSGMQISVDTGFGFVNGYAFRNTAAFPITISTADGINPRIDRIVLRWDLANRQMLLAVLEGTPAASPAAPSLTRNSSVYELALADVEVDAGAISISQADITDKRTDPTVCGYITGTVDEIDFSQITAQFEAAFEEFGDEFDAWFDHMKDQLDTDAAGHLQAEIDEINNNIAFTTIAPPSASGSYYYDGTQKTVSWSDYDSTKVEIQGVTSATDAGTYECRATLKRPYTKWTSGDVNPVSVLWTINKRLNYLVLSSNSITGTKYTNSKTIKLCDITRKSTGIISAATTVGSVSIVNDEVLLTVRAYDTAYSGTVTVSDSGDANNAASTATVTITNLSLYYGKIYGFHLDATVSDPAQMISYEVLHNGDYVLNRYYTPAHVDLSTGVMDPGDWNLEDDFFIPRSCMLKDDGTVDYYLDEDDETKKADGTASDVANTSYGGNAMMEWGRDGQKIYMKIVPDSTPTNGATYYFSNVKLDSDFTSWPFYDCDGNEIDHFYTPKYCGSAISSKLRSISGQAPCNNQQGSTEVTYANANNVNSKVEWDTEVLADRQLINGLLLLIGKNCNTQAVFGQGYTTGGTAASSLANSGTLNGKGQWCGYSTNNDKTKGVKVFGMEHWWGNIWRRIRGYLNMSGTVKYKMTYSQVDGTTQTGYDETGSGYKTVASGTPGGTNGGYANVAVFNEEGFFPKTASGSETTYFCDGLWFNNGQANYAVVGGGCAHGARCGALCVHLSAAFSFAHWAFGAALSCKPLAA